MRTIKKLELRERRVRLPEAAEARAAYAEPLTTPEKVAAAARAILDGEAQEVFLAFLLDIRNRVVGYVEVARGGIDSCPVDPRAVFRAAILAGASGIIVAHNHPSGDPSPSTEDMALTERLKRAGDLLEVRVLDHVIVAGDRHRSLLEEGMMPERKVRI